MYWRRGVGFEILSFFSKTISAIENFVVDDKEAFVAVVVAAGPSSCSESFERYRQVSYQHDQPARV